MYTIKTYVKHKLYSDRTAETLTQAKTFARFDYAAANTRWVGVVVRLKSTDEVVFLVDEFQGRNTRSNPTLL